MSVRAEVFEACFARPVTININVKSKAQIQVLILLKQVLSTHKSEVAD